MRAHEILLEFNVEKTVEHYGAKIYNTMIVELGEDRSWRHGWNPIIENLYREFKKTLDWDTTFGTATVSMQDRIRFYAPRLIKILSEYDPTGGKYSLWIVRLCSSGHTIPAFEDMGRVHDALEQFDALKKNGYFVRNKDQAQFADINVFKKLAQLEQFIDSIDYANTVSNTKADKLKEQEFINNGGVTIISDTSEYKVVVPHTVEASQYYGRNTRWCTAAKMGNMFGEYAAAGDLYIILDKKNNRRWQLHFDSMQFMKEDDSPISDWDSVPRGALESIPYDKMHVFEISNIFTHMGWDEYPKFMLELMLPKLSKLDYFPTILAYLLLYCDLKSESQETKVTEYADAYRKEYPSYKNILTDYGNDVLNFALKVHDKGMFADDLANNAALFNMYSLRSLIKWSKRCIFIITNDNKYYVIRDGGCYTPWGELWLMAELAEMVDGAKKANNNEMYTLLKYIEDRTIDQ